MRLKIYSVHVKPGGEPKRHEPVLVKEGFNPWAFLFTGLWALYHRLWRLAAVIVLFNAAMSALMRHHVLSEPSFTVVMLGFNLLIGFHAGDWQRARLRRQGYITADMSSGNNQLAAEQRYLERYVTSLGMAG